MSEDVLLGLCQRLHFAYVNKCDYAPHQFEEEVLKEYEEVMRAKDLVEIRLFKFE